MPGKVKVRVLAGRQLPIMDRSSDTTDAFAEVKLSDTTFKTDVCRKSLNPTWNSEWFRFDVDDLDLQDEPLQIRIMDYDTYSANDAIGKVYIDLNPLLLSSQPSLNHQVHQTREENNHTSTGGWSKTGMGGSFMSGWLPIFDTMHGIRGEVNIQVKVELFSDQNKFRQSSCGVQFFCTSGVPEGYKIQFINGFVEELVVNDDPEHQWIDKIRTPRASNEARQTLFLKLSGAVQRKIGLKALELGGNCVVGYQQKFDLEGDTGIVVRGIGTAVTLIHDKNATTNDISDEQQTSRSESNEVDVKKIKGVKSFKNGLPEGGNQESICQSPDIEIGCSTKVSDVGGIFSSKLSNKFSLHKYHDGIELLEYPFITLKAFPPGFIKSLGGLVSCRSVKLLEQQQEEEDMRDNWWTEIRREVRSHARALGCNLIVGYTEDTVISDDVVVLCAVGTAAVGGTLMMGSNFDLVHYGEEELDVEEEEEEEEENSVGTKSRCYSLTPCSVLHLPYTDISLPYNCSITKCLSCGKAFVPDVIFTTLEPPPYLEVVGRGCFVHVKVLRLKKDLKGENNAKEISDALPFVEYEIHRRLTNKLKVKGMNALFGLRTRISVSERTIIATATATATFVAALPSPGHPKLITTAVSSDQQELMQHRLDEKISFNLKYYGVLNGVDNDDKETTCRLSGGGPEADLQTGNKDTCVLEIDDAEDEDIFDELMDRFPPSNVHVVSTETLIGFAPEHIVRFCQKFSQVWRGRIQLTSQNFTIVCRKLLNAVFFKLKRLRPCVISQIDIKADIVEDSELQVSVSGSAISLAYDGKTRPQIQTNCDDCCLPEYYERCAVESKESINYDANQKVKFYVDSMLGHTTCLTSLSYVPGGKIDKYLGNLNFFLIRETSSLREAGGLNGFVQSFLSEIYSIVRAHVRALKGNALVSLFMSEFVVMHSPHKNQAQCLIHVGGDAVSVEYQKLPSCNHHICVSNL